MKRKNAALATPDRARPSDQPLAGRIARAEVLALEASHQMAAAEAALRSGDLESARRRLAQVLERLPAALGAHHLSIVVALGQGRVDDAVVSGRAAVALAPGDARSHFMLGRAFKARREPDAAIDAYRRALALEPAFADAHVSLGIALKESGDLEAAIACYERALQIDPRHGPAHANLGNAIAARVDLERRDGFDDLPDPAALGAQARAVAAEPGNGQLHRNHGAMLMRARRHAEAAQAFNRALTVDPADGASCLSLAMCLNALGDMKLAREAIEKWLRLNPADASLMRMLSEVLTRMGAIDLALEWADKAQALQPEPVTLLQMGNALLQARRQAQALERCREALDAAGRAPELYPVYLLGMNYLHENPAPIREAHAEFGARVAAMARPRPARRRLAPGERLRIGYVSGDFVRHSVAFFVQGLFEHHDRRLFEVVAYHNNARSDAITGRLRARTDRWVEVCGSTDEQLRRRIQGDGIDILVDLAGHTAHSRVLVFATAAAPLQVGYLGYPTQTGVPAMDYRVTDAAIDDPRDRPHPGGERPLRLSRTMFAYSPPEQAPAIGAPPAEREGRLTFGSFNNFAKITDHTLDLWCQVLLRVPGSRLLIKAAAAEQASNRSGLERFLAQRGIDPARLALRATLADDNAHLALYGSVDIALDTYPYNGATTTCEALWMGVPVVTRRGDTHTSRMGASILGGIGKDEWVAPGDAQFVETAVRLADDTGARTHWRALAREHLRRSALLDAAGLARQFEALLLGAWAEDQPAGPIQASK